MEDDRCKYCYDLERIFNHQWEPTYKLMKKKYFEGKLKLYMSDCSLVHFIEELQMEQHYTYYLYLECVKCHKIFELGICVRGSPLYKIYENERPSKEKFRFLCIRDNRNFFDGNNYSIGEPF